MCMCGITVRQEHACALQSLVLQPSRKHYGGLGYAKPSCFLELDDPEYADKFEALWDEHVPGFSGKVRHE